MTNAAGGRDPLIKLRGAFKRFKGLEWLILVVLLCAAGSIALSDLSLFGGSTGAPAGGSPLEIRLSSILSSIDGAGAVEVMVYEGAAAASATVDWLGNTASGGNKASGVVIVADGANDVRVRLELIQAVRTLLDLPASAVEVYQRRATP